MRLKLSVKSLHVEHCEWSHACKLRSLENLQIPRPSVGIGPEIKKIPIVPFQQSKKTAKIMYQQFRLLASDVVCTSVYDSL